MEENQEINKKIEEKPEIINEIPEKFKKKPAKKGFHMYIKDFLVYMGIIEREINIDDVIAENSKNLLHWFINMLVTGCGITLGLLPLFVIFKYPLDYYKILVLFPFGFGMLYWVALKARKEFR